MENNNNKDNENREIEIEHRLVIEDEGIEISDLPKEIRQAMRAFNQKLAKYEQSGDENLYYELQQDDVNIADGIENWIEDNEAEDDKEDDSYLEKEKEAKAAAEKAAAEKAAAEKAAAEQAAAEQAAAEQAAAEQATSQTQQSPIEQKILSVAKNNIISVQDLEAIIGREPDYPVEKVGNLTLKKQYLKPFYEVA